MILRSFQVRKYKNVRSSGEVMVEDGVTCLVGKNESGKSALLQALYRLNPLPTGHPERFDGLRDYPRRLYAQDRDRVAATRPVTATFELEDEDVQAVEAAHGAGVLASRRVTVARTYESEFVLDIDLDEKRHVEIAMEEVDLHADAAPEVDGGNERAETLLCAEAREGDIDHVQGDIDRVQGDLDRVQGDLDRVLRIRTGHGLRAGVQHTIEGLLPRFLYFDEYSVMSGRVSVPRLRGEATEALTPGECTTLSLMRLANVDLSEFTRDEYEARKASLEAAANQLTNDVFAYWSQNRNLSVEFDVDFDSSKAAAGPFIELRIRNHRHGVTLNFRERSQGFTWFFSFLATLSELRRSRKMILLLDEPGLGLHASAQRDLLRFIDERLATVHQVVYSTHSPFMVASTDLGRVRTVEDRDGEGTRVSREFLDHSDDTRIPLQAALGHELVRLLPAGPGTLLVREPSDHVYMTAMSGHLETQGRAYLDPRWTIVPVGGLAGVSAFLALLGARDNLAIMGDVLGGKNPAGDSTIGRRILADKGIIRPADFRGAEAFQGANGTGEAGAAVDVEGDRDEVDIEDLFAEEFYVELVNRSGAAAIEPFEIHGEGRIVRRIETATGLGLDRYLPARLLLEQRADPLDGVDEGTFERFETLFRKINHLLR